MTVPDEEVFAFVDGELPPEAMARIEAAMATDPQLALRVETQRALRRLLSGAHAGAMRGTPPGAATGALGATAAATPPPTSKPAEVIAFPGAKAKSKAKEKAKPREPRPPKPAGAPGRGLPAWIGLAACLLIGLAAGRLAAPPPVTLSGADDPPPIAAGPLAQALNTQASGPGAGPVRIALSFVSRSGAYCRVFQASGRAPLAGVACREADAWRVRASGPAASGSTAAVQAMIVGPPLDAAAEAKAKADGWKPLKGAAPR
ncbi:anti-sigma factor family protein [Caulobacter soli]|uniref:anti-sigma factor family protein n=1 Tax=Caulobacter soli TaxID=2708539 RepID=UPI0013ECA375|nr:anti-sigma factor [Caulobacter soli]